MAIPLELVTMLGSGALGGAMTLWSQHTKAKAQQWASAIEGLKVKRGATKDAREYKDKGFQYTRRIIALSAVAAIIVWPKIVPVFWPELAITIGYTQFSPGFLFVDGSESVKWEVLKGLVVTPLDTHLMSAITGLYFGASIVKNA